jgi:signal peptidase
MVVPLAFGYRPLTVLSGSMEPTLRTGDVTVVERITPSEARVGDIVTFRDPKASRLISHRVRRVAARGERFSFVTKGDANNATERWSIAADGDLSRTIFRVPQAGYLLSWTRTGSGRLLLVVLPLLCLCAWELWDIWRPRRERPPRKEITPCVD